MAAGQGFKTFTTGEVLTAGDVNGYLMQGINVFATTTARNAAITAPAEGQFAFTKDTNSLWYYDGAAWVASGATGDIEGVTAGVGISGGGTSGTVTVTNSMATAIDAKGDLVPGTGADTFARLAVGANNTVLTADSAEATGLKWATPTAGSLTLLSTTSMSGLACSGPSITGISGSYTNLLIVIVNAEKSGDHNFEFSFNTQISRYVTTWSTNSSGGTQSFSGNNTFARPAGNAIVGSTSPYTNLAINISRYATTDSTKAFTFSGGFYNSNFGGQASFSGGGCSQQSSAITSFQFRTEAQTGTWSGGTIYIYGVN